MKKFSFFKKSLLTISSSSLLLGAGFGFIYNLSSCGNNFSNYVDILSLNDFHGKVEPVNNQDGSINKYGVERLSYTVDQVRRDNKKNTNDDYSTHIISAGDTFQGSAFSNIPHGKSTAELLDTVGIRYSAVGNHEFDWSDELLSGIAPSSGQIYNGTFSEWGNFEFLACNINYRSSGDRVEWALPYSLLYNEYLSIVLIGATTTDVPHDTAGEWVNQLYEFRNIADSVNEVVEEIQNDETLNPDAILLVAHEGDYDTRDGGTLTDIVKNIKGVDGVFSGHSHQKYQKQVENADGNLIPIIQAGADGEALSKIRLNYDKNNQDGQKLINVQTEIVETTKKSLSEIRNSTWQQVQSTVETYSRWDTQLQEMLQQKLFTSQYAYSQTYYLNEYVSSYPYQTDLGQCFCKLLLQYINTVVVPAKSGEVQPVNFAMWNSGGLRDSLPEGEITLSTLYNVLPFDNWTYTVKTNIGNLKKYYADLWNNNNEIVKFYGYGLDFNKPLTGSQAVANDFNFYDWDTKITISDEQEIWVAMNNYMFTHLDSDFFIDDTADGYYNDGADLRDAIISAINQNYPEGNLDYVVERMFNIVSE